MTLTLLAIGFLLLLAVGYRLYGTWVARQFKLDDARKTPAHQINDSIDFVPTKPFYLFGQHFSAIAAAGPIAGPILACQAFGWLPCLLWIALGVVLISHNMPEVMELADRIEVLRLGVRVARYRAADTTMEQVIAAMTGALGSEEGEVA